MSENLDDYKKQRQELIDSRRLKTIDAEYGGAGMIENNDEHLKPKTFWQKLANCWYHYKWHILITMLAVILAGVTVYQIASKPRYDTKIYIVTESVYDGTDSPMEELFNGKFDNKYKFGADTIQVDFSGQYGMTPQELDANYTKLLSDAVGTEGHIFILDQANYDLLIELGIKFDDLSEYISKEYLVDNDKLLLGNTSLSKDLDMGMLFDKLYMCLIDIDEFDDNAQKNEKVAKNHDLGIMVIKELTSKE